MARQTSFTVHLPPYRPGQDADAEIRFVPEAFSWTAFLFPWLWFLLNRMWLTTFFYLVGLVLVLAALLLSGLAPAPSLAVAFVLSLLVGLEATELKRRSLRRRGFVEDAVVVASSRQEAERRYFATRAGGAAVPRRAATLVAPGDAAPGIIGLFPEADPAPRGGR